MQVGGDLTALLDASEPDLVLNAVVGFAGVGATLWALERGCHARAREQGEPRRSRRPRSCRLEAGRRVAPARRQRALGPLPVSRGAPSGDRRLGRSHRVRRAVQEPIARGARISDRGGRSRASDVVHGPQDHGRLRDPREQGPRAHRSALPLRPSVREDRGRRASDVGRPRARAVPGRRSARAPRVPGHARSDLVRTHAPGAQDDVGAGARLLGRSTLEFEPPDLERFPLLALARASGERGGTYPCAFNAANEVAVAAFLDGRIGFLEIAGLVHEALDEVDGAPAGDLAELVEADEQARRLTERRLARV